MAHTGTAHKPNTTVSCFGRPAEFSLALLTLWVHSSKSVINQTMHVVYKLKQMQSTLDITNLRGPQKKLSISRSRLIEGMPEAIAKVSGLLN